MIHTACGNTRLRPSQSLTSVVMSWTCSQNRNPDISDPNVANISVRMYCKLELFMVVYVRSITLNCAVSGAEYTGVKLFSML